MELQQQAATDPLTTLYNRRRMEEILKNHITANPSENFSIAIGDIDFFKKFNDTYGHPAGDAVIKTIAGVLSKEVRQDIDVVARYGGEEFVILLCAPQPGEAERLAEQIHQGLEALQIPHPASRVAATLTVSIGFSYLIPSSDKGWQTLTEQADQALYHAKSQGRACTLAYR